MRRSPLGKTGLMVPALGFGGAPLGSVYGDIDEGASIRAFHTAVERGIDLVDTSPYYGIKKGEEVLGRALAGGWRERVILSTKGGRIDRAVFDFTPKHMTASLDESLRRLGTDYVDIFIAHDIEFTPDLEKVWNETIPTLHKLKKAGKCRFIGVSGYPLPVLAEAIKKCELDLVLSYCHLTLQNTRLLTELLPLATERGVGLINASPLSMGLLTQSGPPPWHPAPLAMKEAARKAAAFCQSRGVDLADVALRFTLHDDRVPVTLAGMSKLSEVESNLRALEAPADPKLVAEIQAILAPVRDMGWPSGHYPAPRLNGPNGGA